MKQVVFHGGCLGCISQSLHSRVRCVTCRYFESNWNLPDKSIRTEKEYGCKSCPLYKAAFEMLTTTK